MSGWQFWIDRGGTFTDIVARTPDGGFDVLKLLSENPEAYPDAAIEGIRRSLGVAQDAAIPFDQIDSVRMGTTVATNALLERKGARTVFLVNRGFADLLIIGRQSRPRLFDLHIQRPDPLYERVIEVDGRVDLEGGTLTELDEASARAALDQAKADGFEACAISLLHAWKHPGHETRLGQIAREAGFETVSLSHEADPLTGYVPRSATAVADAYLSPVVRKYIQQIRSELDRNGAKARLHIMHSRGGVTSDEAILNNTVSTVLSGPAAGVVGGVFASGLSGLTERPGWLGGLWKRTRVRDGFAISIRITDPAQDALSRVSAHSMPSSQSSWKVRPAARGVSRPALHSRSIGRCRTTCSGRSPATFSAHPKSPGRVPVEAKRPSTERSMPLVSPRSTARWRHTCSKSGIGIRTGQTSAQAPQSEEAKGRGSVSSRPTNPGARTAPIGPE